jgi:tetratricopeptide (TPR) repeat protein
MRALLTCFVLSLALTEARRAEAAAPRPTVAVLPPRSDSLADSELGLLLQDRATGLLAVSGSFEVLHLKQVLSMVDQEDLPIGDLEHFEGAQAAATHLGADMVVYGHLAKADSGWTLAITASRAPASKAPAPQSVMLPVNLADAVEVGGFAMAQAAAQLARLTLTTEKLPPETHSAEAMAGYGKCFPVLMRQPIGIDNPTVLLDEELGLAILGCQAAVDADPKFQEALAALGLALAIRGEDSRAIQTLSKVDEARLYLPLYTLGRFWLGTRYVSSEAGSMVLRTAIAANPDVLLLRGYLAEQLNALGEHSAALNVWSDYLSRSPRSTFAMAKVAYTTSKLGHPADAVLETQAALKQDPRSLALKVQLGGRQIDAGQPQAAIATLTPLVEAGSGGTEAVLRLGYAMLRAGDTRAEDVLKQVLANSTRATEWRTRGRARLDLADLEHHRGHDDAAVALLTSALDEGYRPASLEKDDPGLTPLVERAAQARAVKHGAKPDLSFHPREACPFGETSGGDLDPNQTRPPPPAGIELLHFGLK